MKESKMYGRNIKLPALDDLFSTEEERQDAKLERVQMLPADALYRFKNHPYQVKDDAEMERLVQSIRECGVMTPIVVRPREAGGYEVISGHRRLHASRLAGCTELPAIVREMDDDTAIIAMVDANQQRENILPSEKAKAYKMKLDAMERKAGRPSKENCGQLGHNLKTREIIAANSDESPRQVQRYIRLNELIPELLELVDEKKLKFNPAVEISYLSRAEQQAFYTYITEQVCTPSVSQAQQLKQASRSHTLNGTMLEAIMTSQPLSVKPREMRLNIPVQQIEQYFPQGASAEQMVKQILDMLEQHHRQGRRGRTR